MSEVRVRLVKVEEMEENLYKAVINLQLPEGKEGYVILEKLARRPTSVKARIVEAEQIGTRRGSGKLLVVELYDDKGEGFASCVIDVREGLPPWKCPSTTG